MVPCVTAYVLPVIIMNSMRSTWRSKRLHHLPILWLQSMNCRQQAMKSKHLHSKARCTLNGVLQSAIHSSSYQDRTRPLFIDPVVTEAFWNKEPIVALESTIITHGMPFPHNIDAALEVESIIREHNATPATIGIVNGELTVGLTKKQIEYLGKSNSIVPKLKVSRRDLGFALSKGASGGTTVSGTMVAAHMAGIPVFVTGGIGGVHYGASESFDVSADLTELGKTPVTVICAGIKSILDIGLTLEYLETQGIAVVTYGSSRDFPAFFSSKSGYQAPFNLETPRDVAALIDRNLALGLNSGSVIGVPIPEESSIVGQEIEDAIQMALKESRSKKIIGKDVTPFVLERVNQLTQGKSLEANISLIKNNALVGAQIAVELSKIHKDDTLPIRTEYQGAKTSHHFSTHSNQVFSRRSEEKIYTGRPVVVGACNFDLLAVTESHDVLAEATNKGKLYQTYGGVGRNIAECLSRLEHDPLLISAVGVDSQGEMVMDRLRELEMDSRGILVTSEAPSASYSAIMNSSGELLLGVGDMDIHDHITPDYIRDFEDDIKRAPIVIVDGNLTTEAIESVLVMCKKHQIPVWYEPADISKARKPFTTEDYDAITYISPNKRELQGVHATIMKRQEGMLNFNTDGIVDFKGPTEDQVIMLCIKMGRTVLSKIDCIVATLGEYGVLILRNEHCDELFPLRGQMSGRVASAGLVSATHYPSANEDVLPKERIISVSGAGDCLAGVMIASMLHGYDPHACVTAGLKAAYLSLQSHEAVAEQIVAENFTKESIEEWMTWSYRDIAV